jgi:hypothetical protein
MKKNLLYLVALIVIGATSCRKIEEDGQIVIVGGGGGGTTTQTITLRGRIDRDTVLRAGNNYILSGLVYVVNNATMRIEPGVTVKGEFTGANVAGLIITRGAKIVADATASAPIVFTSGSPTPRSGDWAGIVICGRASINSAFNGNAGTYEVEGGINNGNGDGIAGGGTTPNDDDSSGVLRYVRIEYAGYAFQPDREINSLTMAAVGRKTVIDYVQVTYAKDDAFEWFGGTVNAKHIIAYKTLDDDFDADLGYSGNVQYGISLRDSSVADISRSEAFECDNDASGSTASPQTRAVFSNFTVIGPRATIGNQGNSLYLAAAHIRRNTGVSIMNSIFMGWPQGLLVDSRNGRGVELNIADSTVRFKNNLIVGCNPVTGPDISSLAFIAPASPTATNNILPVWNTDSLRNRLTPAFFGNTLVVITSGSTNQIPSSVNQYLIAPFNYAAPDFTPFGNSANPAVQGASFTDAKLQNTFFSRTLTAGGAANFRGACAPAGIEGNWWRGWSSFINQ